ncbi:uncharacterized protein LOC118750456 [Rhagoletis pomonella]|uniref:uncharacterized protein LOC118750456 n=1 Tax=Rhagoletis pomonella TaxID=28610 RepID=UPI00178272DC|nr:uncharacterized protein LOC118750456 [Rhagoletis pomonella]
MIDEGSAISLIEESVASRLGLRGRRQPLTLQWYGQKCTTEESAKVNLGVRCRDRPATYSLRNVCTIRSLDLPVQSFKKFHYAHFEPLPLEDYHQVKPSLLLGLDNTSLSVPSATVKADSESPVAINTKLGWIAYGPTRAAVQAPVVLHIREKSSLTSLHELVTEYFAADNFGVNGSSKLLESEENERARQMLQANTRRVGKRFEAGLLWRTIPPKLPHSYQMAYKRLLGIEKKMRFDSEFAAKYKKEIAKYIENGYARRIPDDEECIDTGFKWYLPHFAVQNPHKPGKMRIVFDAAAKVNGIALNSALIKGPEHAKPLLDILFRFREGAVAVAADIREMFSQVLIKQQDQQAQRFLWRGGNHLQPVQQYVMQSMVFGAICSPCIAEYVKNKNAEEFRQLYPDAVAAIINSHYVDDFVASFRDQQEAERICREVVFIHAEGGFQLRSFVSNIRDIEVSLNKEPGTVSQPVSLESVTNHEKILGMYWNMATDSFEFQFKFHRIPKPVLEGIRAPTKRELLSIIMAVFDPFGILADFLLFAKVLIQEVWKSRIEWDEVIPDKLQNKWFAWWGEFKRVNEIQIRRWYSPQLQAAVSIQLHIVVDASQVAFAAAGYFRVTSAENCEVTFVAGKTRGAPQKLLSVPRLELQAAVLGVRLAKLICHGHSIQLDATIYWSDSQTVLHWVNSEERKFKPFVGHRIAEILSSSTPPQWRWIPTEKNTTDIATRPRWPPKVEMCSSWLRGPEFLQQPMECWPILSNKPLPDQLPEEVQPCFAMHIELKRVMAWVQRATCKFLKHVRAHQNDDDTQSSGALTASELNKAEQFIIKTVQNEIYAKEVAALKSSACLHKQSTIYALTPFLDKEGIMRIQGRIDAAAVLPIESRKPILMPNKHIVSTLIMLVAQRSSTQLQQMPNRQS